MNLHIFPAQLKCEPAVESGCCLAVVRAIERAREKREGERERERGREGEREREREGERAREALLQCPAAQLLQCWASMAAVAVAHTGSSSAVTWSAVESRSGRAS